MPSSITFGCSLLLCSLLVLQGCKPERQPLEQQSGNAKSVQADAANDPTSAATAPRVQPSEPVDMPTATDDSTALAKRGKILFLQCRSCHSLDKGGPHQVGPNLFGILGTAVGSKEGFVYSAALDESDLIWDEVSLDKFLAKPSGYLSGTKMAFVGIQSPQDRKALIEHIRSQTASE